jgi:hypothetical protein
MARRIEFEAHSSLGLLALTFICGIGLFLYPSSLKAATSSGKSNQEQAAQSASQSAAKPNLAGMWKLNKDQSDDPRQKMREAMGAPNGQGGQGQGGERGAGRPGRGNGPRGGMMAEWNQLTINQSDANVKVTGESGRLLATSQPESKTENNDNGEMRFPPATAEWQGSQLVAKSQGFGGGTTTRTFELSPDGKQLNVTTKIENERFSQPVTFKFVYDKGTTENKSQ